MVRAEVQAGHLWAGRHELLDEHPGLKPKRAEAYGRARRDAAFVTRLDLDAFPAEPSFTLEEAESPA